MIEAMTCSGAVARGTEVAVLGFVEISASLVLKAVTIRSGRFRQTLCHASPQGTNKSFKTLAKLQNPAPKVLRQANVSAQPKPFIPSEHTQLTSSSHPDSSFPLLPFPCLLPLRFSHLATDLCRAEEPRVARSKSITMEPTLTSFWTIGRDRYKSTRSPIRPPSSAAS